MFPELPEINSIDDFTAWTDLGALGAGLLGDPALTQVFTSDPTMITVGEYLGLLDAAEASLAATNFAEFQNLIPVLGPTLSNIIPPGSLPAGVSLQDVIDQTTGLLTELVGGETSVLTDSFESIRALLEDLPEDTILADALLGDMEPIDTVGGGGGGGMPVVPVVPVPPVVDGEFDLGVIEDFFAQFFFPQLPQNLVEAWVSGDPHLRTIDGVDYDFQAAGEYVLLRDTSASGTFEIQSRMIPVGENVSVNAAVAANVAGVDVMVDGTDAVPLVVSGEPVDLADGAAFGLEGGGLITREGDLYRVVFPGEDSVAGDGDSQLSVRVLDDRIDLAIRLDNSLANSLEGLLGNFDGNPDNDFQLADGTVLDQPLDFDTLYGQFREDWRVAPDASLFTYDTGETTDGFYQSDFPGAEVTLDTLDPDAREEAEAAAEAAGLTPGTVAFETAVLDFALTGDDSFIESAQFLTVSEIGTEAAETIIGGTGDDVLGGAGGDDQLRGLEGNDQLSGNDGDDVLLGGAGDDNIDGGDGNDNVAGSAGNDLVQGGLGNDSIGGGLGNDMITGGEGDDVIGGGQGNDTVEGGVGNDVANGGAGDDSLMGNDGNDTMGASTGTDMVQGGLGDDSMGGGAGSDMVIAGDGDDSVGGGEGNDTILGEGGDDFLAGGGRDDSIVGAAGDDRINGGDGSDTVTGGAGADTFIFLTYNAIDVDVITDFEDGVDALSFVGIENAPGSGLQGRLDALNITDVAGGAQITYEGHTILLEGVAAADIGLDDVTFL